MTAERRWTLEFFADEQGREPCREWMENLSPAKFAALTEAFRQVLQVRGLDVCASAWGKQLGNGLFEFRIRHTAGEINRMFGDSSIGSKGGGAILLRVFCHAYGSRIILLVNGYDKAKHPEKRRQDREIRRARKLLEEFKRQQRNPT
jgi:putative component of toxin-antitoxin plasmid stabilization module